MLFCREIKGSVVSIDDVQDSCTKTGSAGWVNKPSHTTSMQTISRHAMEHGYRYQIVGNVERLL